ncbi:MAG: undecaprenyldiphospho-muramoylpentapeptide beta-N-acetylglucosaminyltransferase [Sulfobacillus thermotolerans]|uniref:UDP-N-acetylglucosamine--N-acetylmuramyl-(pentapeptide) pyrophosphoryl-undecaprenol N-acetylglucosamine transferase n=1 Tax=Sulfobacillus thermotolerans TaxID=338644 RepID=A0ABN5H0X0_9FIRM|nr:undecaprenyldiphospho-muramoylpentapeptide beta-N-acetylglucosaminyltransferase [Sulfobacillus thermotolerans]MCY0908316.1 undecaprenyldiphospho-muramoylpentapeptide beta-N-acetylglucosaminyltransferase [Sulfobacillus thermotolerans]
MRMLIAGGGSGGHIYPALAIIDAVRARVKTLDVLYIGTDHGLEKDLVPARGIPFATIHARGLLVKGIAGKAQGALSAVRGLNESLRYIRSFRPDVVVGTGGYVSGPVGLAAVLRRVPLVLQEQNAWPGLTNRLLGPRAFRVIVPFEEAQQYFKRGTHFVVASNPVVIAVQESKDALREAMGIAPDQTVLMATGGSQGAQALNDFLWEFLPVLAKHPEWTLLWATGKRYYQDIMNRVAQNPEHLDPKQVRIVEYFYEIQKSYRVSDVFFGRAGAMTIADCVAFGLPPILVPSPHVAEDHQTKNAEVIAQRHAGLVLKEPELAHRGQEVLTMVLSQPEQRQAMAQALRAIQDDTAAQKIVETITTAARHGRR